MRILQPVKGPNHSFPSIDYLKSETPIQLNRLIFTAIGWMLIHSVCLSQLRPLSRYAVDDGLPSNLIRDITQDYFGFLWVATDQGLCRYDGHEFTVIDESDGFTGKDIRELAVDAFGTLWVHDGKEISYRYRQIFSKPEADVPPPWYGVESFSIVNGNVYAAVSTRDSTIILRYENGKLNRLGFSREPGTVLLHGTGERLYLEDPFQIYDFFAGKITNKNSFSGSGLCSAILPDGEYIFRSNDGLHVIDKKGTEQDFPPKGEMKLPKVSSISVTGELSWFGTSEGLFMYQTSADSGNKFQRFRELDGKLVSRVFQDKQGNFWFATSGNGLFFWSSKAQKTSLRPFFEEGIPIGVHTIYKTADRNLYGFSNGSLALQSGDSLVFLDAVRRGGVNCMYPISDELMLFGTESGLHLTDLKKRKSDQLGREGIPIHSIAMGTGGRIWIAAGEDIHTIPITDILAGEEDLFENSTYIPYRAGVLLEDQKNDRLLIGRENGLWEWRNGWKEIKIVAGIAMNDEVTDLAGGNDRRIWVSTAGSGIWILDGDQSMQLDKSQGLGSNHCNDLYLDAEGNIWAGTDRGVDRISLTGKEISGIIHFDKRSGLQEENVRAVAREGDALSAGTESGLWQISISEQTSDTSGIFPVCAASLTYRGEKVILADTVYLAEAGGELIAGFTSNDFPALGKVNYSVTLEGSGIPKQVTTSPRFKVGSISPGTYTLMVSTCDENGECGEASRVLVIVVPASFWQQWKYVALAGAGLLVIGFLFFRFRPKKQKEPADVWNSDRDPSILRAIELHATLVNEITLDAIACIRTIVASDKQAETDNSFSLASRLLELFRAAGSRVAIPLTESLEIIWHYIRLKQIATGGFPEYDYFIEETIDLEKVSFPVILVMPVILDASKNINTGKGKNPSFQLKATRQEGNIVLELGFKGMTLNDATFSEAKKMTGILNLTGLVQAVVQMEKTGKSKAVVKIQIHSPA